MKYVRQNKRRKGASKEAIIRQRIETARAPTGLPWSKLLDGSKGSSVDQWAWETFRDGGYKTYPTDADKMVAVDNGTVGRFIEARETITIVDRHIVFLGMNDREITIKVPKQQNKPPRGVEWRREQKELKRFMDEAQKQRDHLEAIQGIIAKDLPATDDVYKQEREHIVRRRNIKRTLDKM